MAGGRVSAEDVHDRKRQVYDELIETETITMRDGFKEVLDYFTQQKIPISIGSLTPVNQARLLLERSGLDRFIPPEKIVLQDAVRNLKPAPDVFLETARRMRISPTEQLIFEDSVPGVLAARAAHSLVIAVPVYAFSENLLQIVEAGANRVFVDWKEMNIDQVFRNLQKDSATYSS